MSNRIEMLNRALLRIGADPLETELDPGAPVHLAVYDSVFDYLCGVHPWTQFRETRRLPRLTAPPSRRYTYAFQLPPDRVGAPRGFYAHDPALEQSRATTDYELEGEMVLTMFPNLWAKLLVRRHPGYWLGEFREGFTLLLMSELAMSIREDAVLRERLRRDALGTPSEQPHGGVIGQAIAADSQAEPSVECGGGLNPLIDARY